MNQTIKGICPSKSNCYRIGPNGLYKSAALLKYEQSFCLQCNIYRDKEINGLYELNLNVFYPSNRSDLDNSLKVIMDCLQKVNAVKNDNKCIKIVAQKFIDSKDPRIEFEIIER